MLLFFHASSVVNNGGDDNDDGDGDGDSDGDDDAVLTVVLLVWLWVSLLYARDRSKGTKNRLARFTYSSTVLATLVSMDIILTSEVKSSSINGASWVGFKPSDYANPSVRSTVGPTSKDVRIAAARFFDTSLPLPPLQWVGLPQPSLLLPSPPPS